jgi:hypothetical protein
MAKYLTINQCPQHKDFMSVSIDDEDGGYRLTPSKCCGRWVTIKKWKMTAKDLREIAERFMEAAEELDKSEVKP